MTSKSTNLRRVYVVELSDAAGKRRKKRYPNVYVGETGLTPDERFEKHKAGGRTANSKVTKYGLRLRPDLYEHLPTSLTEAEAVEAEKGLKAELEKLGYRVGRNQGNQRGFPFWPAKPGG